MKILQVTNFFKPSWEAGGVSRSAYEISKHLVERDHDMTVYTTNQSLTKLEIETNKPVNLEGMTVYYFSNLRKYFPGRTPPPIPWCLPFIARKELRKFDIIHIHEHRTMLAVITRHYAMRYDIPYVLAAYGSVLPFDTKQGLKWLFDRLFGYRILKDAAKVIAGAEVEIDEYKRMGIDEDKITLIPPAYYIDAFSGLPAFGQFRKRFGIKEKHIILFLGRIAKIKGIDFLVESFHELAQEKDDAVLVIAGPDGGYRPALESLVKKLNLSSRVLFTGFLDGEDKLSALVDATTLVQTSIYERGPGSPFEAILCNTPIIVTRDTGCGEIVNRVDAGYLVEYGNISELTDIMQQILDNPAEATKKAQKAKEYIMANLSYEKIIEEYERLYESVILSRRGG